MPKLHVNFVPFGLRALTMALTQSTCNTTLTSLFSDLTAAKLPWPHSKPCSVSPLQSSLFYTNISFRGRQSHKPIQPISAAFRKAAVRLLAHGILPDPLNRDKQSTVAICIHRAFHEPVCPRLICGRKAGSRHPCRSVDIPR